MMDCIKSKLKGDTIFWGILILIFPAFPLIFVIIKEINEFSGTSINYFVLLLCGGLLFLMLNILKHKIPNAMK